MYNRDRIASRILLARKNKDVKQQSVGDILGISQPSYSDLETGKRDVTAEELYTLSELFDVPLNWLIGIKEDDFTDEENLKIEEYKRFIKYIRENK